MKKATSKKLLNAVKVDGAVITEENGNVSVRKAPWNETEVISDKPQVIRGRMIFMNDLEWTTISHRCCYTAT